METSAKAGEKQKAMAKKKALEAKKAEAARVAAGQPPTKLAKHQKETVSDSDSDEESSDAAHKEGGEAARPRWTRLHPIEDQTRCSMYTRFAQYAWAHVPLVSSVEDFWRRVHTAARTFTSDDGWWPHIMWQALLGEWCGPTAVVLCPSLAYHTMTINRHIHTQWGFLEAGMQTLAALQWFTGVLWMVRQLQEVIAMTTAEIMHYGVVTLDANLLGTDEVKAMVASGWTDGLYDLQALASAGLETSA